MGDTLNSSDDPEQPRALWVIRARLGSPEAASDSTRRIREGFLEKETSKT